MSDEMFRWVVAGGVLLAGICMLVLAIAMMALLRTVNHMKNKLEPVAERAGPMLETLSSTSIELAPRMIEISADVLEISKSAKEQVHRLGELLTDISDRARAQVARIDGAVEQTVGNVQQAGESVRDAVLTPVRQVNGVLAGIRTAISVYSRGHRQSVDHATQDEEMFI